MDKDFYINNYTGLEIAVIGMSARFPESDNVEEFWQNLKDGKECITFLDDDELLAAGIEKETLKDPNYVKACAYIKDADKFDAGFFGYNPREAELMDPQQRLFLETSWKALEDAGYIKDYAGLVGVYGSSSMNTYVLSNIAASKERNYIDPLQAEIGNDKDYLTTRVSYKLNLKGPSFSVQSACSSSLVAVHVACRALLSGECDMALAGGVSVKVPLKQGYYYQEGGIQSHDGHCRAFDDEANGSIFGSGVGVVVLKPLSDAIRDRDTIYAVIKGSAINNDGNEKVGYTASSISSQSEVIKNAYLMSEVQPSSIEYIETHGTGTVLGDPIEIKALSKAFQGVTEKKTCAIGSVKTNVGHLIAAAGMAGLIKIILCLKNKTLVPSINFNKPNKNIDFSNSPFYVNTETKKWVTRNKLRRAGVSSFGIGGTNAHIILEEAPNIYISNESKPNLFLISAKKESALKEMAKNLSDFISKKTEIDLSNVARTLQIGRESFKYKSYFVSENRDEVIENLRKIVECDEQLSSNEEEFPNLVFLFPGQGSQYVRMGVDLYNSEEKFRKTVDECIQILNNYIEEDLYEILFADNFKENSNKINQTYISQPLLFAIEYSLAKFWIDLGIKPSSMIGHSIGEYVAACLSGVIALKDALKLVAARGRLLQSLPKGAMISVKMNYDEVEKYTDYGVSIAAENAEKLYVLSGSMEKIEIIESKLKSEGKEYSRLKTSHAFHSQMVENIMDEFKSILDPIEFKEFKIPYISNVTGTWIKKEEVMNSEYWLKHLRGTVKFSTGIKEILKTNKGNILLEVGPGKTLCNLSKRYLDKEYDTQVINSLPNIRDYIRSDVQFALTLGALWERGANINWEKYNNKNTYFRVPLPTYSFAKKRYWIEPSDIAYSEKIVDKDKKFLYITKWSEESISMERKQNDMERDCLLFVNDNSHGSKISEALSEKLQSVIIIKSGEGYKKKNKNSYIINPAYSEDYFSLLNDIKGDGYNTNNIIHLWSIHDVDMNLDNYDKYSYLNFYSLLYLAQAINKQGKKDEKVSMTVVVNNLEQIKDEAVMPSMALTKGPLKVIPSEMNNVICKGVDIDINNPAIDAADYIINEYLKNENSFAVYRDEKRYVQKFVDVNLEENAKKEISFKNNGVYLITGGIGSLGLIFAGHIVNKVKNPKLILIGRSKFPDRSKWNKWLEREEDAISQKIKTILSFEEQGAEIEILSTDISNYENMKRIANNIYDKYGKVNGVIHAAGIAGGKIILLQNKEMVQEVFQPKVKGIMVLESVLKNNNLDFLVLCSSTIAVLGGLGQVDYCSANAYLDTYAHYYRKKYNVHAVSVNWDGWSNVGMNKTSAKNEYKKLVIDNPIFDYYERRSLKEAIFKGELSAKNCWLLKEHKIAGKPALPGTAYVELVYRAFREIYGESDYVQINNLFFQKVFMLQDNTAEIALHFNDIKNDSAYFEVEGAILGDEYIKFARGNVKKYKEEIKDVYNADYIISSNEMKELFLPNVEEDKHDEIVYWGKRWHHNLQKVYASEEGALAYIELPEEFEGDLYEYAIHPALLDVATSYAVQNVSKDEDYLPFLYKKIFIYHSLTRAFYSYIKFKNDKNSTKEILNFDIVLFDNDGNKLMLIEDFSLKRVINE
ncbi:beta-ketoacyl synthase [Clostridium botulinum]|uniref:SDR family NAD(P)-dependent oxidoreductase n=1 Tax=Clostridium botulinum TaxID=1491 RepID=UPI001969D607|nr:beta-ketoacyl synthase [Clostridium botulinum]